MNFSPGWRHGGNTSSAVWGSAGGSWIPTIRKPDPANDSAMALIGRWKKVRSTLTPAKS